MAKLQCSWRAGFDTDGLNPEDRARIRAIGLSAWMDEVAATKKKPSRRSLEYKQIQMSSRAEQQNQPCS
jgi:hypothetical protein